MVITFCHHRPHSELAVNWFMTNLINMYVVSNALKTKHVVVCVAGAWKWWAQKKNPRVSP